MVKIDFENCYEIELLSENFGFCKFDSITADNKTVSLGIKISDTSHDLLPDVYNLAFGKIEEDSIDDNIRIKHKDVSKTFSTIIFTAYSFLTIEENENKYLGVDGSNLTRAIMYYRCIQNNFDYLNQFFIISGVNYYIRILRPDQNNGAYIPDPSDWVALPNEIKKGESLPLDKLYNYFIFTKRDNI